MWPFTNKKEAAEKAQQLWITRLHDICRKMVKIKARVGPQVAKTVLAGQTVQPGADANAEMEVLVFCIHVCDRLLRERKGSELPPSLTNLLVTTSAKIMSEDVRNPIQAEKLRSDLVNMYADRNVMYQSYTQLRAERGGSDRGTLVDGFAKILTAIYSKNNMLARTMLTAQGIEIVNTVPHYLDEAGVAA